MDYWEYLAHSQDGSTRSGHRYYARELVGNKGGKNVYRYFYTAEEYSAYKNSKGTPGRGTYAETGTSRNATIWPKGTAKARARAESRNRVAQQKSTLDREHSKASVSGQKRELDKARHKAEKRQMDKNRIDSIKDELDRSRTKTGISARKREMDAARRKSEKRAMDKTRIAGEKQQMDRARSQKSVADQKKELDRKRTQNDIRSQKIKMDAKRTRAKRREKAKSGRDFVKRVLDNTRSRKNYQPKKV